MWFLMKKVKAGSKSVETFLFYLNGNKEVAQKWLHFQPLIKSSAD